MTDEEILSHVQNERNETEVDCDLDSEQILSLVTLSEAYEALCVALQWMESLGDIGIEHLLLVKRWREGLPGQEHIPNYQFVNFSNIRFTSHFIFKHIIWTIDANKFLFFKLLEITLGPTSRLEMRLTLITAKSALL